MKIAESTVPTVEGFYFVKEKTAIMWQIFVEIIGVAPFLHIKKVHPIHWNSDDTILNNFSDLAWSELIILKTAETEPDIVCGITIPPFAKKEIVDLLIKNAKLQAVKFLENYSDNKIGLKEARVYCNDLQAKLKADGVIKAGNF